MPIRVCVSGATGWTGSAVTRAILASEEFQLTGAIARRQAGLDIGEALGIAQKAIDCRLGVIAAGNFSLTAALAKHCALLAASHESFSVPHCPPLGLSGTGGGGSFQGTVGL